MPSHPWRTGLRDGYQSRTLGTTIGLDRTLMALCSDPQTYFVIGGWNIVNNQALILRRRSLGLPYAIWSDTPSTKHRGPFKQLFRGAFLRIAFEGAHAVLGTGRPALVRLSQMGCPPEKLFNLPYFIDLAPYESRAPAAASRAAVDRLVVVSLGRLVNQIKAHDIAIKALAISQERLRRRGFVYRIAGEGPDRSSLAGLASELGVDLEFENWLEPSDVPQFLARGDVLLHPSLHEPYGVAVLEGMAAGMAVLASDRTGAAIDRIAHGVNGLIHQAGDAVQLADQLCTVATDRQFMSQLAMSAKSTALDWPPSLALDLLRRLIHDSCGAMTIRG